MATAEQMVPGTRVRVKHHPRLSGLVGLEGVVDGQHSKTLYSILVGPIRHPLKPAWLEVVAAVDAQATAAEQMTRQQRSLLLYLETRAVDSHGRVDVQHMNADDMAQARAWAGCSFIGFGRIVHAHATSSGTYWVQFTDAAWDAAHTLRRLRGMHGWEQRRYETTDEARGT